MRCTHCGIEISSGSQYCYKCGEPVINQKEQEERLKKKAKRGFVIRQSRSIWAASPITGGCIGAIYLVLADMNNKPIVASKFWWITAISTVAFIIFGYATLKYMPERRKIIDGQFYIDRTSICPTCGSHDIKIYRKGYDYNEAFWGSMFGMREFRYTAGMKSNDAMCHCNHCGREWNSHYDIRKIK